MKIVQHVKDMQDLSRQLDREGRSIAFIPTMGFLHEGHLSLIRHGFSICDTVVVSIFVNPTQFNEGSDFSGYPRKMDEDVRMLEEEGVHVLFSPSEDEIYPKGFQTEIEVRDLSKGLCGDSRPGHFKGVATVVAKLLNIVRPRVAIFGEKDYQQLALIKRMVKDLNFDTEIAGMPLVREKDGLAMSSRNARLSDRERAQALSISRGLKAAEELFRNGARSAGEVIREALGEIDAGVQVEYLEMRDTERLRPMEMIEGEALLAIAARVGNTRLIDNIILKEERQCRE